MESGYTAQAEAVINAPMTAVWDALTDPAKVKQWLFGTDMEVSAWEVGGSIRYRGEWEGKTYEDKGEIVEIEPGQRLVSTYWSAFSGLPDVPENYQRVTYALSDAGNGATRISIVQEGAKSEEQAKHSEQNWAMTLESMKKLLEG